MNDILYVAEYFMLPDQAAVLAALNIVQTGLAVYSFMNWRSIMKKGETV